MAYNEFTNGYDPGVERAFSPGFADDMTPLSVGGTFPFPVDQGGQIIDQLPTYTPIMDPTKGGVTSPVTSPWTNPANAFAPGASQNAPRLFQDPTTGAWTLSEHGNFRSDPDLQANIAAHQQRVTDYWNQFPTGFIQPGQTNFDPTQALTNAQYGTPSNWQSLWTNAGLQPGTQTPLQPTAMGGTDTGTGMGGTLSELSNPERVNQLSQSSYNLEQPWA